MRLYLSSFGPGNDPSHFLRLLGSGRRVAVILNAIDLKSPEGRQQSLDREMENMRHLGLLPEEVDLRYFFGKADRLREVLNRFDALWLRGGNTFVLRRVLQQSGADDLIRELLREDRIVYAGFSAAVAVLAPSLRGIEMVDRVEDVPEGYTADVIWEGLGLLPFAVAPHYHSDHPESNAVGRMVNYFIQHHIPFVALQDGQAIVIEGDTRKVVG